jgi:hypothetical protein
MKENKQWDLLCLFGEEIEGETTAAPEPTPQASQTGEDEASAPAAGETAGYTPQRMC